MLEPYDGKLSRTVLRGEEGRKPLALPGVQGIENKSTNPRVLVTAHSGLSLPAPWGFSRL